MNPRPNYGFKSYDLAYLVMRSGLWTWTAGAFLAMLPVFVAVSVPIIQSIASMSRPGAFSEHMDALSAESWVQHLAPILSVSAIALFFECVLVAGVAHLFVLRRNLRPMELGGFFRGFRHSGIALLAVFLLAPLAAMSAIPIVGGIFLMALWPIRLLAEYGLVATIISGGSYFASTKDAWNRLKPVAWIPLATMAFADVVLSGSLFVCPCISPPLLALRALVFCVVTMQSRGEEHLVA